MRGHSIHSSSSTPYGGAILIGVVWFLLCLILLVAMAYYRTRTRSLTGTDTSTSVPANSVPANKGLKKKILLSLPKLILTSESACKFSECVICLSEFTMGDEIRVLTHCGHGFHVSCVDPWFESHSSCPYCRQNLVIGRRGKGDGFPTGGRTTSAGGGSSSTVSQSTARV